MKKTSIETYYELFYRWQRSGLSKAAFADREGISKVSFYSWCKKFETKTDSPGFQAGFSRIELAEATEMTAAMYSFMASCKKNNLNEFDWLKNVFERIQSINHKSLYQLLPSNWKKYRPI
ncbi:IS66 C-terminal element [Algoriphagus alkaliphilus]|uniref:IS66 C-terminal element n=1 Tax=Algoriphagus alkaliphilus TaxID=279824 RepID=A0A1G5Y4Y2_9BACT|nr:transposase domain-containing protein [Algoriphagus alkaliphilus]SDA77648.1 IS66 C-terminal element [Algoriphagus alkaliphilus]